MEEAGVFLVTQEPMIVDQLSAAKNLMLGVWPSRRGFVDWRRLRREAARILEGTGIALDAPAGCLDAVSRRKLDILRAMSSGGKVIILDEPTAALTVEDRRTLFDFMRRLRAEGVTFFISHFNDEILELCDAVSVLRDGRLAGGSEDVGALTSRELSELVFGRGLVLFERERQRHASGPAIRVSDLRSGSVRVDRLDLGPGEIVGFTGLPGAGAKELARCLFGLVPCRTGRIRLGDGPERPVPRDPAEALRMGIAFLSDGRRHDGLVGPMAIGHNISMSSLERVSRRGFLPPAAEEPLVRRQFEGLDVKAAGPGAAVDTLSGGNQQKVCLGRVIATEPRLLILDEPTRGIDVGVKQEVLRTIDGLTREGVRVIIVSTDTDELVRAADRVCLFADGSVREVLEGRAITSERLRRRAADGSGGVRGEGGGGA